MKRVLYLLVNFFGLLSLLAACAAPTPQIIEKQVTSVVTEKQTVVVESTKIVEKSVEKLVTPTSPPAPTAAPIDKESPMLAELVKAGKLPPLDQRLPISPLVVQDGTVSFKGAIPNFGLGKYGGTLRLTHTPGFSVEVFYGEIEPLITGADISLENAYPNVLQDYKISADNQVFTFVMRKGLKWSDGEPVTMDDVKFTIEDLYFNKDYGAPPSWLLSPDGSMAKFEVVDDYTFKLTYSGPSGALIKTLALSGWNSYQVVIKPKHFLKQWHPKYADAAALKTELDKSSLKAEQWSQLFNSHDAIMYDNVAKKMENFPTLAPYVLTSLTDEAATFVRNPYYWKVDTAGRQLPYIDKLVSVQAADNETANVRALGGDVDWAWYIDLRKAALFMEKGKEMGFNLILSLGQHADGISFQVNGCVKDPVVKPLLNDIRFRQAMNYAMNRAELNDTIYLGFGSLPKNIPNEYSKDKANKLLDDMGLTKKDKDGFRLSPDGKAFKLLIEYGSDAVLYGVQPGAELFAEHLKAVGLNAEPRGSPNSVITERTTANQIMIHVWETYTPTDPDNLFPLYPNTNGWCPSWSWQPTMTTIPRPADLPKEVEAYVKAINDRAQYAPRSPEDVKLYQVEQDFYKNYYWALISLGDIKAPVWANNKLGNVTTQGTRPGALRAFEVLYFK